MKERKVPAETAVTRYQARQPKVPATAESGTAASIPTRTKPKPGLLKLTWDNPETAQQPQKYAQGKVAIPPTLLLMMPIVVDCERLKVPFSFEHTSVWGIRDA